MSAKSDESTINLFESVSKNRVLCIHTEYTQQCSGETRFQAVNFRNNVWPTLIFEREL